MTNDRRVLKFRSPESIDAEAAAWLVRLDRGNLSDEERLELRQWLAEDSRNAVALKSNFAVWADLDELARDLMLEPRGARPERPAHRMLAPIGYVLSGVAVVVVAAVVLSSGLFADRWVTEYSARLETGIGEHKTFQLPDDSVASLNSDTLAYVEFAASGRHVRLERGEARFEVSHDPDRVFAVLANGRIIEAVGTAFVVKIDEDETLVSVTEGRVRVATALDVSNAEDPFELVGTNGAGRRLLHSGEELLFEVAKPAVQVRQYDPGAFERRLAWTEGRMIFDSERLQNVVAEFSRHSRLSIEFEQPELAELEVTGNFVLGDDDAFLEAIEISLGVRANRVSDTRVLLTAVHRQEI